METQDIVLTAVTLLILAEVTYLLMRLPKTTIKAKNRAILVDTSVLMDGRILGIARTGFIGGTLIIPRSVVGELQFLADHADADKRARARQGLDAVSELQQMDNVEVELLQDGSKAEEGVDERLLTLAKRHTASICTVDYNLNKVAVVEGIEVLNINELAQGLRMAHLPGEQMLIELVQKGQDSHQAVGYLADGTMVVVEQASNMIGQSVQVEVIRSLQTAAGKMMFARRAQDKKPATNSRPQQQVTTSKTNGRKAVATTTKQSQHTSPPTPRAAKQTATQPQNQNTSNGRRSRSAQRKQPAQSQPQQTKPKSSRPARIDREANLISLVEQQHRDK